MKFFFHWIWYFLEKGDLKEFFRSLLFIHFDSFSTSISKRKFWNFLAKKEFPWSWLEKGSELSTLKIWIHRPGFIRKTPKKYLQSEIQEILSALWIRRKVRKKILIQKLERGNIFHHIAWKNFFLGSNESRIQKKPVMTKFDNLLKSLWKTKN